MLLDETSNIQVESTGEKRDAYGVYAQQYNSTKELQQLGIIEVTSRSGRATAILSSDNSSTSTTILHDKNGQITVNGDGNAAGIKVNQSKEANLTSRGIITVNSGSGMAQGIAVSESAKTIVTHTGEMTINGKNGSAGIYVQHSKNINDISVKNSGIINLEDYGDGIYIISPVQNDGTLEITNVGGKGAENAGVFVNTPFNGSSLNNEGSIAGANNIAVKVQGAGLAIANSGILQGTIMAVQSDGAGDQATLPEIALNNSGTWRLVADAPDSHLIGGIVNTGTLVFGNNDSGSAANHTVNVGSKGLTNSGIIHLSADAGTVGNQVTIDGDYQSTGGKIIFNSELHDDEHSRTDHLHITGDVLEGDTKVTVNNIGGKGEQTIEGINLITLAGTATGTFTQDGRVVAGAYEYFLHPVDGGWALKSSAPPGPGPDDPDEPVDPDNPQPGPDEPVPPVPPQPQPEPPAPPAPPQPQPPAPVKPVMRPEAIAYAQNLRLANTLFVTREAQRQGVGEYSDPLSGERRTSSLWLTQQGGHTTAEDSSGQLRSQANRYTLQLGGTLQEWQTPAGKFALGAMAGYGYGHGNSHSTLTCYHTRSSVSGYNTGLYGTWRENDGHQLGGYVSSVLQYSWLDNSVNGEGLAAEDYHSRGATVSLEGGYDVAVWQSGEKAGDALYLRPHAQVVWMGVKADDHREKNGTLVSQHGDGNVLSRTGGRLWLDKQVTETKRLESYVEANWLHNPRDFCASMDRVADCQAGNRNQGEVVLGVNWI
ncbi:autotransporter outer membrane beta-barrel domain-containing protein [Escherichia coli]|nr:autotransporter outer membrane beta-barrel domain-containing protein [Escherichia coli]